MDVAIVDVPWNGILEGMKIAAMADAYEVNCAPHNFYGNLSTDDERALLRRHPQFPHHGDRHRRRALEGRGGEPAGDREGHLVLPSAPGWGVEVNEAAIRAHPPRT